ncbi:hypothetical protein PG991_003822 [Apiospora marii]|uniref:Uncharacterized protein n=1 Tax=Apiospora marii TaxID=335849 RepID=A0ABR1S4P5_9PEZI
MGQSQPHVVPRRIAVGDLRLTLHAGTGEVALDILASFAGVVAFDRPYTNKPFPSGYPFWTQSVIEAGSKV